MNQSTGITDSLAMMRSWGGSIALHGALWGLGLWLTAQQVIVPPTLFQWEVSLVNSSPEPRRDASPNDTSSQSENRIRSVVTQSVRKSAAAAPSVQAMIQRTEVAEAPLLPEAGAESSQSVVTEVVPTPDKAGDSTAVPSSDIVAPHETVGEPQRMVDVREQGPAVPNVQSVDVADQRSDGSADPPTEVTASPGIVTHAGRFRTAPDFGWLMQMLWSRVTELKQYPPEARMNRWEGRVVVRVVIDEQGRLLDAAVATGSGHALLDHAALDVIRRSCPLSLPHALGRRQIVLRVPIQYKLDS